MKKLCNYQILTPLSQHQLNAAINQGKDNLHEWVSRMQLIHEVPCDAQKTKPL
jgi:hypothetical protein